MRRSILQTFITQAPTLLLYFLASTVMTRMLGDTGRGEYALLTNQAALLSTLLSLNIGIGITYFTAKTTGDARTSIGAAASMLLLDIVLVPFLLWGISRSSVITGLVMPPDRLHWAYWGFVYLLIILSLLNGSVAAIILGLKRFKILNAMALLNAVLSAVGFLALYLVRERIAPEHIFPAVLVIAIATIVLLSLTWCGLYALVVRVPPVLIWKWSAVRPILAFSMVGHLSNLINLINYRFDVWVVDYYHGAAELGLYAVAVGVAQLLFHIPEPFARVMQPFLFGQVKDEVLARYKAVARFNFTAVLVLSFTLAIMANWIIPFLYGEVFRSSVSALQLLLPGILFSSAFKLLAQLVIQGGVQQFNLLATSVGAFITIGLDWLLIPHWGIEGAAIASTASYFFILVVVVLVIRYRLRIPVHDLFLLRSSDLVLLRDPSSWKPVP